MDSTLEEETTTMGNNLLINFLRHFQHDRMLETKDASALYRGIYKDRNFEEALETINKTLQFSKLQIKFVRCEATCKEYYVLVSTHFKKDVAWPSGMFTESQLDYFQNILKHILLSERGAVSTIDCLNLDKKFNKVEAQNVIDELIRNKFVTKLADGKITLSPLGTCELGPFILQELNEAVSSCNICKKAVIYGVSCTTCSIKIHKFCFIKYKEQIKKIKCPNCNTAMPKNVCDED